MALKPVPCLRTCHLFLGTTTYTDVTLSKCFSTTFSGNSFLTPLKWHLNTIQRCQ